MANSQPNVLSKALDELKKRKGLDTDADLARWLGVRQPNIVNWRKQPPSPTVLKNLFEKIENAAQRETRESAKSKLVHAIVEFHPIFKTETKEGWLLFATSRGEERIPFLAGLKKRLENTRSGVYIFYDSSGIPLYVGQVGRSGAKANNLWRQLNASFNRPDINRRQYGYSFNDNEEFVSVSDKGPKVSPKRDKCRLYEVACSFSAYEIGPGMPGTIEALLLRVTGNMLLNDRVENLT